MEAEAPGHRPSGVAARVLEKQERLIGWQIASEQAGAAIKLLTSVAGAAVAVFVGAMVWQAAHTDGIVLQPFATPPAMAENGLTGAVVAGQVLDRLKTMEADTQSNRAVATYGGGWGEGIRLSIPNTGISLGEVQAYLVRWLGHETQVGGEVFQTPDGQLAITTRVGGAAGATVKGPPETLDALIGKSAEAVYGPTQPYLYSLWLSSHGRAAEGVPILQRLIYSADKTERLWALLTMAARWAGAETEADRRRYIEAALRVDPNFMTAVLVLSGIEFQAGNDERSLQLRRRLAAGAQLFRQQTKRDVADEDLAINEAFLGTITGDFSLGVEATRKILAAYSTSSGRVQTVMRGAQHAMGLHDLVLARRIRDDGGLNDAALATLEAAVSSAGSTGGSLAARERLSLEDWPAAAEGLAPIWTDTRAFPRERAASSRRPGASGSGRRGAGGDRGDPRHAGLAAGGRRSLRPLDRPRRGGGRGRTPRGGRWVVRARRGAGPLAAPGAGRLEPGPCSTEARLGRRAGWKEARLAVAKSPRWPDAQRAEGRALHALQQDAEAVKAYTRAAALTPNWGALDLDWGIALAAQGQREAAVAKWRTAGALDLSPADRARLNSLLRG